MKARIEEGPRPGILSIVQFNSTKQVVLSLFIGALLLAIAWFDLYLPLGIAWGTSYIIVVLLTWFYHHHRVPLIIAPICIFLVVLGYYASPESNVSNSFVLANRFISILALASIGLLLSSLKRYTNREEMTNERLNQEVDARTAQLHEKVIQFHQQSELLEASEKMAKEALMNWQKSERLFEQVVNEVSAYAIILLSPEGKIESWNNGAQRLFGYLEKEVLGRDIAIFHTPEQLTKKVPESLLQTARDFHKSSYKGPRIRKDGTTFEAHVVLTSIYDEEGCLKAFAKITRDKDR